jgi:hypothetical protein
LSRGQLENPLTAANKFGEMSRAGEHRESIAWVKVLGRGTARHPAASELNSYEIELGLKKNRCSFRRDATPN